MSYNIANKNSYAYSDWLKAYGCLTRDEVKQVSSNWSPAKKSQMRNAYYSRGGKQVGNFQPINFS